ncbi:hypothetical protein D3C84_1113730 [compost metagenome]
MWINVLQHSVKPGGFTGVGSCRNHDVLAGLDDADEKLFPALGPVQLYQVIV